MRTGKRYTTPMAKLSKIHTCIEGLVPPILTLVVTAASQRALPWFLGPRIGLAARADRLLSQVPALVFCSHLPHAHIKLATES